MKGGNRHTVSASNPAVHENPWVRRLLIALSVGYTGVLVGAPVAALAVNTLTGGLAAAAAALAQPAMWQAFLLTLKISLLVVAVHTVLGTLTAWMLARDSFPGLRLLNSLVDLPFAISPVVVGYMLLLLFGRTGLLAPLLEKTGIRIAFAVPGMVLATLFVSLPFMIRELVPVIKTLDRNQEHAAATMGAGRWHIFWKITFPGLRWGLLYGVMLTFARALGEFGAVLVIGGGIQGRTETATLFIYRALDERQYTEAYIAALLLGLFSFLMVFATDQLRRHSTE